jgi:hypothetical protein
MAKSKRTATASTLKLDEWDEFDFEVESEWAPRPNASDYLSDEDDYSVNEIPRAWY